MKTEFWMRPISYHLHLIIYLHTGQTLDIIWRSTIPDNTFGDIMQTDDTSQISTLCEKDDFITLGSLLEGQA